MYGASPATVTSKDLNLSYPPATPFGGHRKEEPESELHLLRNQPQREQPMSSSLLRFRSAPSSLLGELCEDLPPVRPSSAGTENMFARFLAPDLRDKPSGGTTVDCQRSPQFRPLPPSAEMVSSQQKVAFSSAPPMMYHHSQQQQQLQMPSHSLAESSHRAVGSMAMEVEVERIENGGGRSSSNVIRQSSSPAGLFSHLNVDNDYAMMRGLGDLRNGGLPPMGDAANRLKGQISLASRQNSLMSQISEMGSEEIVHGSHEGSRGGGRSYIPGVQMTSWEETSLLSPNNFSGMKRGSEGKIIVSLNQSEPQNGEMRNQVSGLTHQLSLPKTSSSEMAAIEKFLQFQDAVPCRIRAKRGCATHPRSIAERARRTKISERMRKLQELVPNMDKQTNTADMLELAVDYIKDLQKQVKALTEGRASCTCLSSKQESYLNTGVRD